MINLNKRLIVNYNKGGLDNFYFLDIFFYFIQKIIRKLTAKNIYSTLIVFNSVDVE